MKAVQKKYRPSNSTANHQAFINKKGENFFSSPGKDSFFGTDVQAKLKIGRQGDKYEQEADAVANRVVNHQSGIESSTPLIQADFFKGRSDHEQIELKEQESTEEFNAGETDNSFLQFSGGPSGEDDPSGNESIERSLSSNRGGGVSLEGKTRNLMENRIGADFSGVKIHTGNSAVQLSQQLNARAFTHGNDIYFNKGQFQPETTAGKHLLAHELTHTVQQGASIQRKPLLSATSVNIQRVPFGSTLNNYARYLPGWTLLTVIIGYNPLLGQSVARTAMNLVQGILELFPVFGVLLFNKLNELGILDRVFTWISYQVSSLNLTLDRVRRMLQEAWDEMDFIRLDPFDYNTRVLRNKFGPLVRDITRFAANAARQVLSFIKEALLSALRALASHTPGYDLFTMILGRDPLTGETVEASTVQIIETFLILIGQQAKLEKMRELGTIERVAAWIDEQLALLNFSFAELRNLFSEAWNAFSFEDLRDPVGAFTRTIGIFAPFVGRVFRFAYNVGVFVLRTIKDALLNFLSSFAQRVPGFTLLTVILGRNPFTSQPVPRTAVNLIGGFMEFIPGGREKFQNLQESGAIDRALTWLNGALGRLNLNFQMLIQLFRQLWQSFTIHDLINPLGVFQRIVDIFGPLVMRIIRFAGEVGMKILEFIFEGVMGAGGSRIMEIFQRVRATFLTIVRDPIGFVRNLINAVMLGFRQFSQNILQHLQRGIMGWILGSLEGAGLQLPERFDLRGIVSIVLQILGITYARIRPRLVRILGEQNVARLESVFDLLRLLVTEGPMALWQRIVEMIGNLRDMVLDAIKNWVITRIITAAVTRIVSMFNPAGAVIQAILAIYNTIMFFIERINQIAALVNSIINSIASIASGQIAAAANFVEQTMGRTIPVIISFLARLIGLGGIANTIRNIIARIRRPVDRAIDGVINFIVRGARRLVRGGRAIAGRIASWWRARKNFQSGSGENHSLFFEGEGENATLMIASRRQSYSQFVSNIVIDNSNSEQVTAKQNAQGVANEIDQLIRSRGRTRTDPSGTSDQTPEFNRLLTRLAQYTSIFMVREDGELPVSTPPSFGGLRNGFATSMRISILTKNGPAGTGVSVRNPIMNNLLHRRSRQGGRSYYIAGHLLNNNLHGPGTTWSNLTPLTQEANRYHLDNIERQVKRGVNNNKIFEYSVVANYGRSLNSSLLNHFRNNQNQDPQAPIKARVVEAEQHIPSSLGCSASELDERGNPKSGGERYTTRVPNNIDENQGNYRVRGS